MPGADVRYLKCFVQFTCSVDLREVAALLSDRL
jgi:hypothetical protein